MPLALMPLPYDENALAPHISSQTLAIHHGKHHRAYVDKTNAAIAGTDLADATLNQIVAAALTRADQGLFNNAAQAWNHGFYWHSLSPNPGKPSAGLALAIEQAFGSLEEMRLRLVETATGHFASGWAWLVAAESGLEIVDTHDAATALSSPARPLLAIDVWEHAYYLDTQNDRRKYVSAVVDNLLNWDFASANHACDSAWLYPG